MRSFLDSAPTRRFRLEKAFASAKASPRCLSLLDFGADTVKAAVVCREERGMRVMAVGLSSAGGGNLEGGRVAVAALAAAADEALMAAEDETDQINGEKIVPDDALFCVPARLTRGELFTITQKRPDSSTPISSRELKTTWQRLSRIARQRLPGVAGDGSIAWKPLALAPATISVDGHQITDPVGQKGHVLTMAAFGVAVPPAVLRGAESVAQQLELTLVDLMVCPQSLASLVPRREAVLVDVGYRGTSVNLVRYGALWASRWWPQGGRFFSLSLSQAFRCSTEEAEELKRAYIAGDLLAEDEELVKTALKKPVEDWFGNLIENLSGLAVPGIEERNVREATKSSIQTGQSSDEMPTRVGGQLPSRIYMTGGGSLLPDLTTHLASAEFTTSLGFNRSVEIESLGRSLSSAWSGRSRILLDVPPQPLSDLLAGAIGLAASAARRHDDPASGGW